MAVDFEVELKNMIDLNALTGYLTSITNANIAEICSSDLDNLDTNKIYAIGLTSMTGISHLPMTKANLTGTIVTIGKSMGKRLAGDVQIYIDSDGTILKRTYWSSAWSEWKYPVSKIVHPVPSGATKISEILEPGDYIIDLSAYSDAPKNASAYLNHLEVFKVSNKSTLQVLYSTYSDATCRRGVNTSVSPAVSTEWVHSTNRDKDVVIGFGDSICRGTNNDGKSYLAYLGFNAYVNKGLNGATLGNYDGTPATIHSIITSYTPAYPERISAIVLDGGINDYYYNVTLGTVPTAPAMTSTEAEALDKNTTLGGLGYALYKLIELYPAVPKYFVITHKTKARGKASTRNNYWPATRNNATVQYSFDELVEALKKTCAVYGIQVIDIYNNGIINTAFDSYVASSATPASDDWVQNDGIHPLDRGYRDGYAPYIRKCMIDAGVND